MPTPINGGNPPCRAPQPPVHVGRGVEVELILWVRALHAMGEDGHLSGRPRNASANAAWRAT
jgi:hypothetical protein